LTVGLATGGRICDAAQILDRVAASLGNVAITESDVEREYRFERFLDAQWPPPPPNSALLTDARERLTYQMLLTQEESPGPADRAESEKSALRLLATIRQNFARPEDYQRALKDLGMTETELVVRIAQQELMLRLIDQRLRPEASPTDDEVTDYYRSTFAQEFQKKNSGAATPPLSQVEGQIREVLTQKHMNELLDQWIEELKPTTNVRFHTF